MNLDWIKVLPSKETPFNKEFFEKLSTSILDYAFPVGKTEIFYDAEDHSDYLGFKWERTCIGRTPVGIDSNDTDFNSIGKTGGSKYSEAHYHDIRYSEPTGSGVTVTCTGTGADVLNINNCEWDKNYNGNKGSGSNLRTSIEGTGDSGNLQPYEVVAFWKRVE